MTWLNHCNKSSNVNSWASCVCEKGCLYCCCCCILSPVEHSRTHCQAPFVLTPRQLGGNSLASFNGAWKKTSPVLLFFHLPSLFPIPGPLSPIFLSILILENLLFFFLYCLDISSQSSPLLTSSDSLRSSSLEVPAFPQVLNCFWVCLGALSWHHSAWLVPASHQRHGPGEYSVPLEVSGLWPPETWSPGDPVSTQLHLNSILAILHQVPDCQGLFQAHCGPYNSLWVASGFWGQGRAHCFLRPN